MDDQHFDNLVRSISTGLSRRKALRSALGGLAAAGGVTAASAEAKKGKAQGKGKNRGKKKSKGRAGKAESITPCVTPATCTNSTQCCDPNIPVCGTYGNSAGECCRTKIGIFCSNTLPSGHKCCAPNYVCHGATCQCNTADGFVQQDNGCHCLTGCIVDGKCADARHCATTTTTASVCVALGGTCNACHACCAGSTCGPNNAQSGHACDGAGGTCCTPDGSSGNVNHPDLCCSGCLCPDGNCCNAVHCATTTTVAPTTTTTKPPCVTSADCPGKQQVCCGPNTDKPGQCVGKGKDRGNRACFRGKS